MNKYCACCGEVIIKNPLSACPVCGWVPDETQEENPKLTNGTNKRSLQENKEAYYKHKKDRRYF